MSVEYAKLSHRAPALVCLSGESESDEPSPDGGECGQGGSNATWSAHNGLAWR